MRNSQKIILDLCGGTGSWSKPYKNNGYDVRLITLPEYDVMKFMFTESGLIFPNFSDEEKPQIIPFNKVYGILAAPPCTMFSFARTNAKKPRDLREGMECVRACLDIIWKVMEIEQDTRKKVLPLKFWALENPNGMLKYFLGKPAFEFNPFEFGDEYKKRTYLWGWFNEPKKKPLKWGIELQKNQRTKNRGHLWSNMYNAQLKKFDMLKSKDIHSEAFGKLDRQTRRSITPQGFAKAFFKANQ